MHTREIQEAILKLKKEKDAVILAHSYQAPEILEVADYTGDSFRLSVVAKDLPQKTVLLCGVRFMADTVKILSPEKTVILPVPEATCPMAEQISPERVLAYRAENPGHKVVAYINTTTALKAVCDVCVTSSSALKIVGGLPEKDILFIPDQNLGSYIAQQLPEKNIILWDGMCPIHGMITPEECAAAKAAHPHAKLLMHPELPASVVQYADYVGSTAGIIQYALSCSEDCIIGTEKSIADFLSYQCPDRRFYQLSKRLICPDMRLTTLMDLYQALRGTSGEEIQIEEKLRLAAKHAIDEMIRLGD
ncbi:MAG TPA: quinolinate synthase NadA [Firmicutes bacterium]|nr:quinolinate synthase NadA [Bacillota bacterium]